MKSGVRISGGFLKGKRIHSIAKGVRPTSERIRESFFSIIAEDIADGYFFDVFAGSGIMGVEAISRGAPKSILLEKDPHVFHMMVKNIQRLELDQHVILKQGNAMQRTSQILLEYKDEISFLYIDPPYKSPCIQPLLYCLDQIQLQLNYVVICEYYHKNTISANYKNLQLVRTKKYGDTALSFWKQQFNKGISS